MSLTIGDVELTKLQFPQTAVFKRLDTNEINVNQILLIAGAPPSQMDSIIQTELGSITHAQPPQLPDIPGLWAPLNVCAQIAQKYGVYEPLMPLFSSNYPSTQTDEKPALNQTETSLTPQGQLKPAPDLHEELTQSSQRTQPDGQPSLNASNSLNDISMHMDSIDVIEPPKNDFEDVYTLPPLETNENSMLIDASRDVFIELFLTANRGESTPLEEIILTHDLHNVVPDVPIDDAGHTALHWAASLGKASLVADLVQHGADCRRGNNKGESPLVRAVLVTNSCDNQSFEELLDLLFPCLHLGDNQGRTLLHHIALTAGIPGRSDASRYYLDTLLEWAVKSRGASGVTWLLNELVDAMDANGDTALNIAARLGSTRIAQQLVEIGASVELSNRAGLKPTDFGITSDAAQEAHNNDLFTSVSQTNAQTNAAIQNKIKRANLDNVERRSEIVENCGSVIQQFDSEMNQLLVAKDQALKQVHEKLRAITTELKQLTATKDELESLGDRKSRATRRTATLDNAILAEKNRFAEQNPGFQDTIRHYDADEPFLDQNFPISVLKARVRAYKMNNDNLVQIKAKLKSVNLENEAKYKHVVAKCTSSDESKVDEILDDLIAAVSKEGDS